jgi:hypothetical protein
MKGLQRADTAAHQNGHTVWYKWQTTLPQLTRTVLLFLPTQPSQTQLSFFLVALLLYSTQDTKSTPILWALYEWSNNPEIWLGIVSFQDYNKRVTLQPCLYKIHFIN